MNELTKNEAIALMHENEAWSLRKIADYIDKCELTGKEAAELLIEIADEQEAQSIVVSLRGQL